jgi:hypothetical protein
VSDAPSRLLRRADSYAALAHLGQWRVDALGPRCGVPWIEHPRAVAATLAAHPDQALRADWVLAVALLHTVLWRCAVDPDQLDAVFGREIGAAVRLLSPWLRQRAQTQAEAAAYWQRLPRAPRPLRAVVGAAWLDHLAAALRWPEAHDPAALRATVRARVLPLLADEAALGERLERACVA